MDITIDAIPVLKDNYVWVLRYHNNAIIVDPGEALPVLRYLKQQHLIPSAILMTHHHHDHIDGATEIYAHYPTLQLYGPEEVKNALPMLPIIIAKDSINIDGLDFNIIETPGHTAEHIVFYHPPYLFTGDTLFSAGCGRLFEKTAEIMYHSLKKLFMLPDETQIYCGHEYTISNLNFAQTVYPNNTDIKNYLKNIIKNEAINPKTLPSTIQIEKKINPFFIILTEKPTYSGDPEWLKFAILRKMKDNC